MGGNSNNVTYQTSKLNRNVGSATSAMQNGSTHTQQGTFAQGDNGINTLMRGSDNVVNNEGSTFDKQVLYGRFNENAVFSTSGIKGNALE